MELAQIMEARQRIAPYIKHTPLLRVEALDKLAGFQVYIKPENLQTTGSFKLRGATNKLLSLSKEQRESGIIAASSGNHAQGVAAAAARLGVEALIVMPENAPQAKVEGTKEWGARVLPHGRLGSERNARMKELAEQQGLSPVHPYEDPLVIAGQGTAALEILADEPEIAAIVAPVGGGGLISGLAIAAKGVKPGIRMVGAEPAYATRYAQSRAAGQPLTINIGNTIADGTRGDAASPHNFPIIENLVDDLPPVEEDAIKAAIYAYARLAKLVVEPSGALSLAAAISGRLDFLRGQKVCLFISGGNVDLGSYGMWLAEGAEILAHMSR